MKTEELGREEVTAGGSGGLVCRVAAWKGNPPGSRALTSGIWGHRVVEQISQEGRCVASRILDFSLSCGKRLSSPVSDVGPSGPSNVVEKVVTGMGCLSQVGGEVGEGRQRKLTFTASDYSSPSHSLAALPALFLRIMSSVDICTLLFLDFATTFVTPFLKTLSLLGLFPSRCSDSWLLPDCFCPSYPLAVSVLQGSDPALTFPNPIPVPWGSPQLGELHPCPLCPGGGCLLALAPAVSSAPGPRSYACSAEPSAPVSL